MIGGPYRGPFHARRKMLNLLLAATLAGFAPQTPLPAIPVGSGRTGGTTQPLGAQLAFAAEPTKSTSATIIIRKAEPSLPEGYLIRRGPVWAPSELAPVS